VSVIAEVVSKEYGDGVESVSRIEVLLDESEWKVVRCLCGDLVLRLIGWDVMMNVGLALAVEDASSSSRRG